MTTIYKEDCSKERWLCIVHDLELPPDTDEIIVKHISHVTEIDRQKKKGDRECQQKNI